MATLKEKFEIFISSIDKRLEENKPDLEAPEFSKSSEVALFLNVYFNIFPTRGKRYTNKNTYDIVHDYWLKNKNDVEEFDEMCLMICWYLAELDFDLFNVYNCNKEKYNYSSYLEIAREMFLNV